jgi:uncharacterized protein YegL
MIGNFFKSKDGASETRRFTTGMDALDERLDSGLRPGQVAEIHGRAERSCDILFVLDSSGSMSGHMQETVNGFNAFLDEQQAHAPDDARMSLAFFNHMFDVIIDERKLIGFPRLMKRSFNPIGGTALLDALGKTIARGNTIHEREGRPQRTLVVLLTDGEETDSHEYSAKTVRAMVERARARFGWEFILIGVGMDAGKVAKTARDVGILPHLELSVAMGSEGLRAAFRAASGASVAALRGEEIKLLTGGK